MRFLVLAALISAACFPASQGFSADLQPASAVEASPAIAPVIPPDPLLRPDSIFFFAGALSTSSLGSTLKFNLDQPAGIKYDNYIAGAAYNHDFYRLGYGFNFGVEVGVADRFGQYALCCNTIIKTSGLVNSAEIWAGPRISYDGFVLFDTIRIAGAATTGLSYTTNSIGREREREIGYSGSARTLIYFGPEIIISLVDHPEFELVYREHHRSGANGTFGKLREGYNANVFGVRYKF